MSSWPDHFPENCPPDSAVPVTGIVYRFVDNLEEIDFFSFYDLDPTKNWGNACKARGLSVFRSQEVTESMAAILPSLRRKQLAKAELTAGDGVIGHTPSRNTAEHYTFWPLLSKENLVLKFQLH